MADNIDVTPGTGKTIAADDIGGILHQRIKVAWGVDGAAVDASATNPFPVSIIGSAAVTGTFWQATQPVSLASLPALAAGTSIVGKVGIDQTTAGTTNGVSVAHIGGTAVASGNGTVSAGVQRVAIASDNTPFSVNLPTGAATAANQATANGYLSTIATAAADTTTASPVRDANTGEWETVAASATAQAIGATGATGDWISHIIIVPATTSPGAVSIKDGAGSAITIFAGGASSVTSLVPFTVALDMKSLAGAWSVTTGTNVSAIAVGNFT